MLLVLLVSGAAAWFYLVYAPKPTVPLPAEPQLAAVIRQETLRVGNRERSFLAYVPPNLPPRSALVIVLHGSDMNGDAMRQWTGYEFDRLADERNFVVLYPDGYKKHWNDCRKGPTFPAKVENIDDVGLIEALIARLQNENGIDPARVYLFGYSNGGHMGFRMAQERPDEIAAIAAVGANSPVAEASSCPNSGKTTRDDRPWHRGSHQPVYWRSGARPWQSPIGEADCGGIRRAQRHNRRAAKHENRTDQAGRSDLDPTVRPGRKTMLWWSNSTASTAAGTRCPNQYLAFRLPSAGLLGHSMHRRLPSTSMVSSSTWPSLQTCSWPRSGFQRDLRARWAAGRIASRSVEQRHLRKRRVSG
jgi:pimeloyl-ACP methyl ester carboxylesterase